MKLGLFLLVLGLLIAGVGIVGWVYADPDVYFWTGTGLSYDDARVVDALGAGLMVIGGGFIIGGLVRMIVKR